MQCDIVDKILTHKKVRYYYVYFPCVLLLLLYCIDELLT